MIPLGMVVVLSAIHDSTDKLKFGPVKFIVDGSIQGFTARLRWPGYFSGQPNGLWLMVGGRILITPFSGNAAAGSTIVLIGRFTDEDEYAVKRCLDSMRAVNQR
jgi:hypothetical protein